jgi:hypothetical protein
MGAAQRSSPVRLSIRSDGTPAGTKVYAGGQQVKGVTEVSWRLSMQGRAECWVKITGVQVDVEADGLIGASTRRSGAAVPAESGPGMRP